MVALQARRFKTYETKTIHFQDQVFPFDSHFAAVPAARNASPSVFVYSTRAAACRQRHVASRRVAASPTARPRAALARVAYALSLFHNSITPLTGTGATGTHTALGAGRASSLYRAVAASLTLHSARGSARAVRAVV